VKLLAVCTANICRSPSIEAAIRSFSVKRDAPIDVASAGTRTRGGHPADADTVTAARRLGFDLSAHISQALTPELIDWADLIVCAEIDHLAPVLSYREEAFVKSFLFLEFVDKVSIRHDEDDVPTWLQRVGRHRTPSTVLDNAKRYNLADPYKRGKRRQQEAIALISEGADRLVEAWAG
jgi:protein-tyrosine-phosphatase